MPVVSVLTAVAADRADHLAEAGRSILGQVLPPAWHLEWVVQIDGEGDVAIPESFHDDPSIHLAVTGQRYGAAVSRNLAAARATGEVYKVVDADDVLTGGQLARDLAVLTDNPDVGWVTCRALDLEADGSLTSYAGNPEPGRLPRGSEFTRWSRRGFRPSVLPSTLAVRAPLLWLTGGWMALDGAEDTALLLAVDSLTAGWFLDEPGLHYRRWEGQVTASVHYNEPAARERRAIAITRRVTSLREAVGTA